MPDIYVAPRPGETKRWKEVIEQVLDRVGERPRTAMLGAYSVLPPLRFATQQEDEDVVLLLRAHPITNVGWILLGAVMLVLPGVLLATGMFAGVPGRYVFIGRLAWYLVTLVFAMEKFLYWYYSVFVVTNERLVDVDFENLLYRVVTYANLDHIEEPAMFTGGFIRSLFQYGDVFVTTASKMPSVEALAVPWPQKVVDIISRLAEELVKRRQRGE